MVVLLAATGCAPTPLADDQQAANNEQAADNQQGADDEQFADDQQATAPPTPEESADGRSVAAPVPVEGELVVHFLDVGQGDATLLISEDATVLVDTGRHNASDVVPHLRARGVQQLDLVVVTHPHADHLGQFDRVITTFDVAEVWWSGATHTTQNFERALTALEASDAAYEEPRAGDATTVGQLVVEVVNPPPSANFNNLHDSGLGLRVTFGEVAVLFTGDIEAPTEARMLASHAGWLAADIYQVGHHGSNTSTSPAFLQAVDPAVAVYSASAGNQYGHPHRELLTRLDGAGVDIYGTDVHGTVTVTTDGADWTITTETGRGAITPGPAQQPPPDTETNTGDCVDINTASVTQLQQIIHIGPQRAEQLIALRPFNSVSQLTRISGIGPSRLADIEQQGVACVG